MVRNGMSKLILTPPTYFTIPFIKIYLPLTHFPCSSFSKGLACLFPTSRARSWSQPSLYPSPNLGWFLLLQAFSHQSRICRDLYTAIYTDISQPSTSPSRSHLHYHLAATSFRILLPSSHVSGPWVFRNFPRPTCSGAMCLAARRSTLRFSATTRALFERCLPIQTSTTCFLPQTTKTAGTSCTTSSTTSVSAAGPCF
ncbi:hypothetical protein EJF18_80166 [Clavispora lusitaniae]|uniref:Uncharacterized protein n=1 Tax=Clavispora lusitaniae TaxID=36911 RepID=A0ACD0WSK7_CLALS|nr:hypothetical protein EJF14_80166 [Clavispora lusitaniae]QFZ36109.1 hypothetical protein EJF16_80166 [Clavispora lusitaniae]QFZ41793.1 hypothetical protein EJF15_80166 [Clavispora lusitaniae]QFZ47469.1 hypothetical protein EJF18_80166 [Clavispora lusitaniae]QFZ53148.1 hypothetical protein EJF17_80166 [Clavispora lusitaniae]